MEKERHSQTALPYGSLGLLEAAHDVDIVYGRAFVSLLRSTMHPDCEIPGCGMFSDILLHRSKKNAKVSTSAIRAAENNERKIILFTTSC